MGDKESSVHGETVIEGEELAIDNVLSAQPELGPIVPDGGYGWIVFLATSFFQVRNNLWIKVEPSTRTVTGMFSYFYKYSYFYRIVYVLKFF